MFIYNCFQTKRKTVCSIYIKVYKKQGSKQQIKLFEIYIKVYKHDCLFFKYKFFIFSNFSSLYV